MQLLARDLAGATLAVDVAPDATGADACAALCEKAGVPSDLVRLVFEGKQLDLASPLADASV